MQPGAAKTTRLVVKSALEPMRKTAIARSPGTHTTIGQWRVSVRGATGALTNRHPGAPPWEFGGTIYPRGAPITFERAHMIYGEGGALETGKHKAERGLISGFERLARESGWQ